jgi:aminoglycoside phosphotransferase family enzyme
MQSMIDDLLNPLALPDKTESVFLIQTHISMVIVSDHFVYKIKKPVNFGFLDFTTLEKRRHFCEQEVKLNRRLSKGLYIGVIPVIQDGTGYKLSHGDGEIVEYAVKMKRIPDEDLMKSLFHRGELRDDHLKKVAAVLARFHRNADHSVQIDEFGKPEMFRVNTDENFAQTEKYIGMTIEYKIFKTLREWTAGFYRTHEDHFIQRIEQERIRDCHGDLHMEHISLGENVYVFDCIEFNDRFRYSDTLSDIAFLLMDLEFHGGKEHAQKLWRYYEELAGEADVGSLLRFYKVYRAYVRGKVSSFQFDDNSISRDEKERTLIKARKYFSLACAYAEGGKS